MRINREDLLSALIAVAPGLAKREFIEQSTCYVFGDGVVQTFNDEIACTYPCRLDVRGAVSAAPLQTLLGKLQDDDIEVREADGQFQIKGGSKRWRTGVRMEVEVTLPLDNVEQPKEWHKLHEDFCDAVKLVHGCAAKRDSNFCLTCVHIHPEHIEACDNMQAARWSLDTGVSDDKLIKRETIATIIDLEMTEIAETQSWVHFRNAAGLILSCRRHFDEEYPSIGHLLVKRGEGAPVTLPGGLAEMLDKAEVFSSEAGANNRVMVRLKAGRLQVKGEGVNGWYEEVKQVAYDGDPLVFLIGPQYLNEIARMNNECEIVEGKLALDTGKFRYITCTGDLSGVPDSKKGGGKSKSETVAADVGGDDDIPF